MTAWAWAAVLVASNLTNIFWVLALHQDAPLWTLSARMALLAALWLLATRRPELAVLRPSLIALIAAVAGLLAKDLIYRMPAVTAWVAGAPWRDEVVVSSALKLLPVAAMALTVLGLSRRDLFLVRGSLGAPGRIPFTASMVSWIWLALGVVIIFGVFTATFMFVATRPDLRQAPSLVPLLPIVIIFAAINAFSEEFTFRSVLLARLQPAVGSDQALWMTSVRFGLGHWFGSPPGGTGAIGAMLLGLMLGKSMLETKGIAWAWLVHFVLDVVIFSVLILSHPRP